MYNFSENRVIDGIELEGLEWIGLGLVEDLGVTPETTNVPVEDPIIDQSSLDPVVLTAPEHIGFFERIGDAISDFWNSIKGSDNASTENENIENTDIGDETGKSNNEPDIPKDWETKASKKGGGKISSDPTNPHNSIREMPGNPESPNPGQQNPYYKFLKDGIFYDKFGKPLENGKLEDAHIPKSEFNPDVMPTFT